MEVLLLGVQNSGSLHVVTVSATLDDSRNQILLLGASASGMCLAAVSLG